LALSSPCSCVLHPPPVFLFPYCISVTSWILVCVCSSWNLCGQHSCPLDLLLYSQRIHSWWASLDRYIPGTWYRISSMSIEFWNIVLSIFGRVYRCSRIDTAIQVSSKNVMSNVLDLDGRRWQGSSSNRNINTLMSTCSHHPMDRVPVGGWSEVSTGCFGYQCMPAPRFFCTGFGRTHQPAAKTGLLHTYQVFRPLISKMRIVKTVLTCMRKAQALFLEKFESHTSCFWALRSLRRGKSPCKS
jgi:hypothetical protein